jgi:hypothetical protein
MSKLITTYANSCGIKLPKEAPKFPTCYYPIPNAKYITLHIGAGHDSRKYDYYQEVVNILKPILKNNNIHIVQIGTNDEPNLDGVIHIKNNLSLRQSAFVLANGICHIGSDSCWTHIGGSMNLPILSLHSNSPLEVSSPYYKDKHIALDADRGDKKWTYSATENPKTINTIKPEDIAKSTLELLNIQDNIKAKTFYIGDQYNSNQVDIIPDYPVDGTKFANYKILIRGDVVCNYNAIGHILNYYSAGLVLNKPIPIDILNRFKSKIKIIYYIIDSNYNKDFISKLHTSGIKYHLLTEMDGDELNNVKLDLFDFNAISKKILFDKSKIKSNLLFKTNRLFNSNNKFYPSVYHYTLDQPFNGEPILVGKAIDYPSFLDSCESYYFFEKSV